MTLRLDPVLTGIALAFGGAALAGEIWLRTRQRQNRNLLEEPPKSSSKDGPAEPPPDLQSPDLIRGLIRGSKGRLSVSKDVIPDARQRINARQRAAWKRMRERERSAMARGEPPSAARARRLASKKAYRASQKAKGGPSPPKDST
jgi:hypothetical protein